MMRHPFRRRIWVKYLGKGYVVMMKVNHVNPSDRDANVAWSCDKWWRVLTLFRVSKEGKITGPGGLAVWGAAAKILPKIVKTWNRDYELYVSAPKNSKLWDIYRTRLLRRGWIHDGWEKEMYLPEGYGELYRAT